MDVTLIAAIAGNGVIGRDNGLPWRLPADMAHFKRTTLGHAVIMGRRTYESMGKPLPQRRNIAISRTPQPDTADLQWSTSLDGAIDIARNHDRESEIFIAGGAAIYRLALPIATRMILTHVAAEIDGDTFFPDYDPDVWQEESRTDHAADDRHDYAFAIVTMTRK